MRSLLARIVVFSFFVNFFLANASVAIAADLQFSNNTTLNLTGVNFSTFTIVSGSTATSLTVDTSTFTVTVPSSSTFTVNASADITFSNTGGVGTTCGTTSSMSVTGPVANLLVTPTNTACTRPRSSAVNSPPPAPTNIKAVATPTNVTLTWTDPITSDFSITIFRNAGGSTIVSGILYASVSPGVGVYIDTRVNPGETYQYLVRANSTSEEASTNTTTLSATIPLLPLKVSEEEKKEVQKEEQKNPPMSEEKVVEQKIPEATIEEVPVPVLIEETKTILSKNTTVIAEAVGRVVDPVAEQNVKSMEKFSSILATGTDMQTTAAVGFIAYGTKTTEKLGEGERAGSLDSFRKAYGKLPETEEEWQDALRIAGGQSPEQENAAAEMKAVSLFTKVYTHAPDLTKGEAVLRVNDGPEYIALRMAAYGIRPSSRDLVREQKGIGVFKGTFGRDPKNAEDWDAVRMIAYSGVAPP